MIARISAVLAYLNDRHVRATLAWVLAATLFCLLWADDWRPGRGSALRPVLLSVAAIVADCAVVLALDGRAGLRRKWSFWWPVAVILPASWHLSRYSGDPEPPLHVVPAAVAALAAAGVMVVKCGRLLGETLAGPIDEEAP